MWELRILELLIALFLLLPLIRPFFKRLWPLDGLTMLPLLALGAGIGIFPAYGTRPECIPLVAYTFLLNLANLQALGVVLRQLKNDDFRDRGIVGTGFLVALLIAVAALAVGFAPSRDATMADSGARSVAVRDEERNVELFLRIYVPELPPGPLSAKKRPLVMLAPPAALSLPAVDRLCAALSRRGFAVLAYSRWGVDAPAIQSDGKKRLLSPTRSLGLLWAMLQGTRWASANVIGRSLEEERKQDLAFLLSSLRIREGALAGILAAGNADRNRVFIAGYGAGGAAAAILASEEGFATRNPAALGIIGLESPILSALGQVTARGPAAIRGKSALSFLAGLGETITEWAPKRVRGVDQAPRPEVPVLFILSDRALSHAWRRQQRYESILETYRRAANPAALVMVPGAGPLDYSDVPEKYPLLSRLFPGDSKPLWTRETYALGTASLIANFCAALLDDGAVPRTPLDRAIHVEVNGAWNFAAAEYILGL
jgi:hypothetical protein